MLKTFTKNPYIEERQTGDEEAELSRRLYNYGIDDYM